MNNFLIPLAVLVLLAVGSQAATIAETSCVPNPTSTSTACAIRDSGCTSAYNRDMFYLASSPCGTASDRGCQCAGFCGFTCAAGCNAYASRCMWTNGKCVRKDGQPELDAQGLCPKPPAPPTTAPTSQNQANSVPRTESPTSAPTLSPTAEPTAGPTQAPTFVPTSAPTEGPTSAPTEGPTSAPTPAPTESPVVRSTNSPSESPTLSPTLAPTESPSESPTLSPTLAPTEAPSESPTTAE